MLPWVPAVLAGTVSEKKTDLRRFLFYVSLPYSVAILRPLQAALHARGDEVRWFLEGVDAAVLDSREIRLSTVAEVKEYSPEAVFVPGNWVPDFFPGVKVQLFHACGVGKKGHFRIRGFFDLYCTHGVSTTAPFLELADQHGHFHVIETGWPKHDPLFRGQAVERADGRPRVLYAPTFSPSLSSAPALCETIEKISRAGAWDWTVKYHSKMNPDWAAQYTAIQNDNLRVSEDHDLIPLLRRADVVVSDTSSVIYEAILAGLPVVTFRTDWPGEHLVDVSEPEELEAAVAAALEHPEALMEASSRLVAEMHPQVDGRASERVLEATDRLLAGELPPLKPKPLNLWRRWQARKRLGYYRLR